jgi:hypothetical protein
MSSPDLSPSLLRLPFAANKCGHDAIACMDGRTHQVVSGLHDEFRPVFKHIDITQSKLTTRLSQPFNMKQIINFASPEVKVELSEGPIPSPAAHQVLIKVVVSGSNPKDWKSPVFAAGYDGPEDTMMGRAKKGVNQGDDIAGIVEKVGDNVLEFKV